MLTADHLNPRPCIHSQLPILCRMNTQVVGHHIWSFGLCKCRTTDRQPCDDGEKTRWKSHCHRNPFARQTVLSSRLGLMFLNRRVTLVVEHVLSVMSKVLR